MFPTKLESKGREWGGQGAWDPFLERPGNLTGPESYFEIKVSRKVGCVLTCNEVHFVYLAYNFTVKFFNVLKVPSEMKQLNGAGNYRELRETAPWLQYTLPLYTWMLFVLSKNQAIPLKQDTCINLVSVAIVRHPLPVGRSLETSVLTKTSPFN